MAGAAPPAHQGGGGSFLTHKAGFLPVWGWGTVGLVVLALVVYEYYKSSSSSTSSTTSSTTAGNSALTPPTIIQNQLYPPQDTDTAAAAAPAANPGGTVAASAPQPGLPTSKTSGVLHLRGISGTQAQQLAAAGGNVYQHQGNRLVAVKKPSKTGKGYSTTGWEISHHHSIFQRHRARKHPVHHKK